MGRCGGAWLFGLLAVVGVFALGLAAFPELLLAGTRPPRPSTGPAPLIGVGLPIAGAVVATVLVALRLRRKD